MRFVLSLTAVLFTTTLAAQTIELDRAAVAMAGQQASFTHTFTPKGFKTSQVERGTVLFGKLPAMRWSYTSPEEKLFVFDGSRSWFYVPGDKQVTVARVNESMRRELPFLLLGDPASRGRVFSVSEAKRGNAVVTTLKPKDAKALVRAVTVTIAPSTHHIQSIDYTDREGNRTTFQFSGYHPRSATAASFKFEPPAGVQVVEQ
jgi:outer membrane lipoprotein carrier protein